MTNLDLSPAVPLTEEERKHYQALAAQGKIPTLEICRRFIATIRKNFTPEQTANAKKSRVKTPVKSEDQIDFF